MCWCVQVRRFNEATIEDSKNFVIIFTDDTEEVPMQRNTICVTGDFEMLMVREIHVAPVLFPKKKNFSGLSRLFIVAIRRRAIRLLWIVLREMRRTGCIRFARDGSFIECVLFQIGYASRINNNERILTCLLVTSVDAEFVNQPQPLRNRMMGTRYCGLWFGRNTEDFRDRDCSIVELTH